MKKSNNPFAFVILTVLLALKKNKKNKEEEEDLLQLKIELARKLLKSNFSKPVIRGIYYFIRNYVIFENKENDRKFEIEIDSITNNKSMGIVEMLVERGKKAIHQAGMEEGIEKGRKEGIEEGIEKSKAGLVKKLLAANKFTDAEIANFADVTEEYVREIKKA